MGQWLGLVLLLGMLAGCASATTPPAPTSDADPRLLDFRKQLDEDPTRCAHVWQQVGVHPYETVVNGLALTQLCTVTQCAKCGLVLHECERRR